MWISSNKYMLSEEIFSLQAPTVILKLPLALLWIMTSEDGESDF